MELNKTKCPFCKNDLTVTFVDIGEEEPSFIMGLTCDCDAWIEREIEKSIELKDFKYE